MRSAKVASEYSARRMQTAQSFHSVKFYSRSRQCDRIPVFVVESAPSRGFLHEATHENRASQCSSGELPGTDELSSKNSIETRNQTSDTSQCSKYQLSEVVAGPGALERERMSCEPANTRAVLSLTYMLLRRMTQESGDTEYDMDPVVVSQRHNARAGSKTTSQTDPSRGLRSVPELIDSCQDYESTQRIYHPPVRQRRRRLFGSFSCSAHSQCVIQRTMTGAEEDSKCDRFDNHVQRVAETGHRKCLCYSPHGCTHTTH
jgi:hypothetical protein